MWILVYLSCLMINSRGYCTTAISNGEQYASREICEKQIGYRRWESVNLEKKIVTVYRRKNSAACVPVDTNKAEIVETYNLVRSK